jgi:hypothetical protein
MRLSILLLLVAVGIATATIIHVPGDSAKIQAGLSGALTGDTVLVAAGAYSERIIWPARDGIVLLSEAGAEATAIDGERLGRVLTMNAMNYSAATRVEGFTITNGLVATYPCNGAGVWCRGEPVFMRNRIVNNLTYEMGYGGGVYADGGPTFAFNLIAYDTIWRPGGGGWRYGPGICCTGSGVFYQNVFLENAALDTFGGGFWYGGGLYLAGGSPVVFSNLFLRNRVGATTGGLAYGGGLCIDSAVAYIANNTFVANMCTTAIPYGGAIYVNYDRGAVIKNNIIVENVATGISPQGGGISCRTDTLDTLHTDYNDVWNNQPTNYLWCVPGPHELSLDPLFVTGSLGDYYLSQTLAGQPENGPCLDAGDTVMVSPINIDSMLRCWTTRTDTVHDAGAIDMGYHYLPGPHVGIGGPTQITKGGDRLTVLPNPAHGSVMVRFRLARPGTVRMLLFDVSGRQVFRRSVECRGVGEQSLTLDPPLPAGVYLLMVETPGEKLSAQLIVAGPERERR